MLSGGVFIIGWKQLNKTAFSTGKTEIYFKEIGVELVRTLGPRHICYQAMNRSVVDEVAHFLHNVRAPIIRGPIEIKEYSENIVQSIFMIQMVTY